MRDRNFKMRGTENDDCCINCINCISVLSGGPLMDDVYKLEQYHCHWGCSDSRGSEHTVNGQAFAGEVRFTLKNSCPFK